MITLILLIILAVGFFCGWNIGSHDAANSMGTSVGSRILTVRRAVFLLALFVVLGAVLEGHYVMGTLSKGIVHFDNENAAIVLAENMNISTSATPTPFTIVPIAAVIATLAASIWILMCTYFGLPASTGHSLVGAITGAGLAIGMFGSAAIATAGVSVNASKFIQILISWVMTPLGAIGFAFLFYHVASRTLKRVKNISTLNRMYSIMTIATACYMAYTFGANDVSHGVGLVLAADPVLNIPLLALFGAVAMICGAAMYSSRMIETIGKKITVLAPVTAFSAQLGAAMTVHLFVWLSMPVSTSHAVVGGVIGAGLVKGSLVAGRKLGRIPLVWALTPFVTMAISFAFTAVFMGL
jgi:PiT family inorganic phosphate transporter